MNPVLKRLLDELQANEAHVEQILERAAEEERDLSDAELELVRRYTDRAESLRPQLDELTRREEVAAQHRAGLAQLESLQRAATPVNPFAPQPIPAVSAGHHPAVVRRDDRIYGPGRDPSFFRDLVTRNQDAEAAERWRRHYDQLADLSRELVVRADAYPTSTDGAGSLETGAGLMQQTYYPGLIVESASSGRPFCARIPTTIISQTSPISVPKITTGPTAFAQTEGTSVDTSQLIIESVAATPGTLQAAVQFTFQLFLSGTPGVDQIAMSELMKALDAKAETDALTALIGTSGTGTDTWIHGGDGADIEATVRENLFTTFTTIWQPADLIVMRPTEAAAVLAAVAADGRSLLPYYGPSNASGVVTGLGGSSMFIMGVPVTVTPGLGSNAEVIVGRADQAHIWQSNVLDFRALPLDGNPALCRVDVMQFHKFVVLRANAFRELTEAPV